MSTSENIILEKKRAREKCMKRKDIRKRKTENKIYEKGGKGERKYKKAKGTLAVLYSVISGPSLIRNFKGFSESATSWVLFQNLAAVMIKCIALPHCFLKQFLFKVCIKA